MSKPVYGSPTTAMSLSSRLVPQPVAAQAASDCCHAGAVTVVLQPEPVAANCLNSSRVGLPLSFQTASVLRAPVEVSVRDVPPTATTPASTAGASGSPGARPTSATRSQLSQPESPEAASTTMPGWSYAARSA